MIKPPFNYTGNKNRLIEDFSLKYFPRNNDLKFLDLFGGGSTVSVNVEYNDITYNDINIWVSEIIKILKKSSTTQVLNFFREIVDIYGFTSTHFYGYKKYIRQKDNNGLKHINQVPFLKLREDINNQIITKKTNKELWLKILFLSFYSFNNDIRFNKKGLINIPVGKTDLNTNSIEKIITFMDALKRKKISLLNLDFQDINFNDYDFIYADPPYLATTAIYNDGWKLENELTLLKQLIEFHANGGKFVLSNMLWKKGQENTLLKKWADSNNFKIIEIDFSYKSSSYNRDRTKKDQEVIITNVEEI